MKQLLIDRPDYMRQLETATGRTTTLRARSDDQGVYVFAGLLPGTFTITVQPPLGMVLPVAALNFHSLLFFLFAALACGFALGVVVSDNVVRMALYLILEFPQCN